MYQEVCTRYWDTVVTITNMVPAVVQLIFKSCKHLSSHYIPKYLGGFSFGLPNGLTSMSNKVGNLVIVPLDSHAYLAFSIP